MTTQETFKPSGVTADTWSSTYASETPFQAGLRRWKTAREGWAARYEKAKYDLKMVSGDQWDPKVKASRESAGLPCPTFNREHTAVQQITNAVRQQRPAIKVNAVSDAKQETAEVYEGIIRHIEYRSQASVAYDHAVECAAGGSIGFFRLKSEWLRGTLVQDLLIERILDPLSVFFDPAAVQPDLSDAMFCFVREYMTWDAYRRKFGKKATMQDIDGCNSDAKEWGNDNQGCWIAEYWQVEITTRRLVRLADGTEGYDDEIGEFDEAEVETERDEDCRALCCSYLNGMEEMQKTPYDGEWIPIFPVMGREMVVDGKRELLSAVRFTHDGQTLFNGFQTGLTTNIALSNNTPWVGPKGSFKDPAWKDAHRIARPYLEYDAVIDATTGQPLPAPQRTQVEPAIQALTMASQQAQDNIRASQGYQDAAIQPSKQADLSGVAVERRTAQTGLINFHFGDNLNRTQWHLGRAMLDLIPKRYDTPRAVRILGLDGSVSMVAVTQALEGGDAAGFVDGYKPEDHHFLNVGIYDVTITAAQSHTTRLEEQSSKILEAAQIPAETMAVYGDLIWKGIGEPELEERAKFALLPAIQQSLASKDKIPPQLQAQMAAQQQQIQQLTQALQQAALEKEANLAAIKLKGEIDMQKNTQTNATKVVTTQISAKSNESIALVKHHFDASKHLIDKETEAVNADIDATRADESAERDREEAAKERELATK